MSTEKSGFRSFASRLGTLLESLLIFILLLSGIGVIFAGKVFSQLGLEMLFLSIGMSVEIIAVIIIGFYIYFRFLRREEVESE